MSVFVLSWVFRHSPATGSARLVLLALADCAHDDGSHAYPSQETLAAKARVSRATCQRALATLEADGQIERVGFRTKGVVEYRVIGPDDRPHSEARASSESSRSLTREAQPVKEPSGSIPSSPTGRATATVERTPPRAPRADSPLIDEVVGILQRGLDSLSESWPRVKRPAITAALSTTGASREVALEVAQDVRSVVQAADRAPNVTGLYVQKLTARTQRRPQRRATPGDPR